MKNKAVLHFIFFLLLFSHRNINGQVLQNFVISTQGNYNDNAEVSITWTLGEVASAFTLSDNLMLNEGFNQPFEDDGYLYPIDEDFSIFPNPTMQDLLITFKNPGHYKFRLYNTIGQLVLNDETVGAFFKLNLSKFANAIYLIRIQNDSDSINTTLKIIKTD
ncbi:MAG: T9SS type A sorting domain-containing protein [Bacteroidetes bacterium]|nr:T9SS type A sorting domain-containing protein [Bacteroidota bacterium]